MGLCHVVLLDPTGGVMDVVMSAHRLCAVCTCTKVQCWTPRVDVSDMSWITSAFTMSVGLPEVLLGGALGERMHHTHQG